MVILGGVASLWGGVLGAAVLVLLQESLSAYTTHWEFWTGWVLLAVVLFARRGLAGWLARAGGRGSDERRDAATALLDVQQLSQALRRRGRERRRRPAGARRRGPRADRPQRRRQDDAGGAARRPAAAATAAGSSSPATTSRALSPHERARRGLARSFQITRLFKSFDVLDNVALAVQAAGAPTPRRCGSARQARSARRVDEVLAEIGLADKAAAAHRRALARRAARARGRPRGGEPAAPGAARRADGRHGPRGIEAHGSADPAPARPAPRCC